MAEGPGSARSGKILLDVALAVALGGDCLADVGMLRAEPTVFGPASSDPTVSRLIDKLAGGGHRTLTAIRTARAEVRQRVWKLAGASSPDAGGRVIVDLDGVLGLAHSEKQDVAATWKKSFGHHPLMGFVDHGRGGTGEPVAALLRPGNAGSDTAADHITATQLAPAQLRRTRTARPYTTEQRIRSRRHAAPANVRAVDERMSVSRGAPTLQACRGAGKSGARRVPGAGSPAGGCVRRERLMRSCR